MQNSKTKVSSKSTLSFPVVGIGASAGGLEALKEMFQAMPTNTGMAFVIIQHLDPSHPSLSSEILARATELEVEEVQNKTQIRLNHVYLMPPNHNIEIKEGQIILHDRKAIPAVNKPIDIFFRSLARSSKGRAIGIVLSGTGTDGTLGMWAIKAEGGINIAQDPKSAKHDGMPKSAINAGIVDLVLNPKNISAELTRISQHPLLRYRKKSIERKAKKFTEGSDYHGVGEIGAKATPPNASQSKTLTSSENIQKIFDLVHQKTKVDFRNYKQSTISRRIRRRMIVNKTAHLSEYVDFLESHSSEVQALYDDILINVTRFFRDPECYEVLTSQILPRIIKKLKPGTPLRVWVPGCSTGEEVYSILITLLDYFQTNKIEFPLQIFGTDISDKALQIARLGQYSTAQLTHLSKKSLDLYFDKVDGGYKMQKSIRNCCLFSHHDMISDPPFAKLDIISCRNVLIYFSKVLQKRMAPIFHYALKPEGLLILGKSENPPEFSNFFEAADKSHQYYRRLGVPGPIHFRLPAKSHLATLDHPVHRPILNKIDLDYINNVDKILLDNYTPPGVVINNDLDILQFRGRTIPFLEPATGQPSLNLLKMVRPELLVSIRSAVQLARKKSAMVQKKGLLIDLKNHSLLVDIEVVPINPKEALASRTYLVIFKGKTPELKLSKSKQSRSRKSHSTVIDPFRSQQIRELIKELSELKDYQHTLIEQYEAIHEELTSSNEELQSTNEELQSTNEEIETAKEELQSTNEELMTVNDELQSRNSDLTTLSSDLNNLLSSIEIPILMVGRDHRIRRFSPKAQSVFNINSTDVNRSIRDIRPNFEVQLDQLVSEVTETLQPKELELKDDKGRWCRICARPYRTIEDMIDGAVVSVLDIDLLKKKEFYVKESLDYATSVAETVSFPLVVVNTAMQIQSANRSFFRFFEQSNAFQEKNIFSILKSEQESADSLKKAIERVIQESKPFRDIEINCEIAPVGFRKVLVSGGKVQWIGDEKEAALISFQDVTEQRKLENERQILLSREQDARALAEKANQAKDIFLAMLSHELRTPLSPILSWAQMIAQGLVDFEKAKQGAAIIAQCAKTQSQLINDLLDISRIMAGKLSLDLGAVDPEECINSAIESVRPLAEKKSIDIHFKATASKITIDADSVRLQQVIWNLLTNAIKFSPPRSAITINMTLVGPPELPQVKITMEDCGKGISPDFLPHIFKRFTQADSESTRVHGGLGLGLSIVHNLVELFGGTITAENSVGHSGAIFTVILPARPSLDIDTMNSLELNEESLSRVELEKRSLVPRLRGLNILVIEDDEPTREALKLSLETFEAKVLAAESTKEGFQMFLSNPIDVLVCDIAMPGENGYELIAKIRSLPNNPKSSMPAIALTAFASGNDIKKAISAGFQIHIAKPVETIQLGKSILELVSHSSNS